MWQVIFNLSVGGAFAIYFLVVLLSVGFWIWMTWMPKQRHVKNDSLPVASNRKVKNLALATRTTNVPSRK